MVYIKKDASLVKKFIKKGYIIFDIENKSSLNYIQKICKKKLSQNPKEYLYLMELIMKFLTAINSI